MKDTKKILCTGSAGFICSHIVEKYEANGHKVISLDKKDSKIPFKDFYKIDLSEITKDELVIFLQYHNIEVINHHAAQIDVRESIKSPAHDANENIINTLKLLEASVEAGVKRFIFASSGGAIDGSEFPSSPYGIAKLTIEKYLKFFSRHYNIETIVLRYSNAYGPRQTDGVIPIFINKLLNNDKVYVNGGAQTRNFIYIDDIAEANYQALFCTQGLYDVSSDKSVSVNQVLSILQGLIDSKSEIVYNKYVEGEVLESNLPCSNFSFQTNLQEGLKQTISYIKRGLYEL